MARLLVTRPREGVARARNRVGRTHPATLRATPDWNKRIEAQFGSHASEVGSVREVIGSEHLYDADPALARAIYSAVRSLRPHAAVETGVARGVSSRFILEAMDANNSGHLWSIDLPPVDDDARFVGQQLASAVTNRDRWTLIHGYSRSVLPKLLRRIEPIDIFIHDSAHSQPNMLFEYRIAWRYLRPGGLLISDDIHLNAAWGTFISHTDADNLVCESEGKNGLFGIAVKPG